MNCNSCDRPLVARDDMQFSILEDGQWILSVKDRVKHFLTSVVRDHRGKETILKCLCGCKLGRMLPFGPREFHSFSPGYVKVNGRFFGFHEKGSPKPRWKNMRGELGDITVVSLSEPVVPSKDQIARPPLVSSPLSDLDYDWHGLTTSDPYQYQYEAYAESLRKDILISIPTGYGKTLIASLLIARMKILNPRHMSLVVVERIPLVYQHSESITRELHLRVVTIIGGEMTPKKLSNIQSGMYDVVIGTVGALMHPLNDGGLKFSWFSCIIMDECHHAMGGHGYVELLGKLHNEYPASIPHPRLMGLSATLVQSQTFQQACAGLSKLRNLFYDAHIYHVPFPIDSFSGMKFREVKLTSSQSNTLFRLKEWIVRLSPIEIKSANEANPEEYLSDLYGLRNMLPSHRESMDVNRHEDLSKLIDIYEVILLLHQSNVCLIAEKLHDDTIRTTLLSCLDMYDEDPVRFVYLYEELKALGPDSRCVIFTDRRLIAELLSKMINEHFGFSSSFIIGHQSSKGMDSMEQKSVLKKFNSGEVKILVSTSVIEEGLDVQKCDTVIRYSGVNNLIRFIQSGGRARDKSSRFIIFQSAASAVTLNTMRRHAENLMQAITDFQRSEPNLSLESRQIINHINSLPHGVPASAVPDLDPLVLSGLEMVGEFSVEVFLPFFPREANLESDLRNYFGTCDIFRIMRFDSAEFIRSRLIGIFPPDSFYATVSFQTVHSDSYPIHMLDSLCNFLDFSLKTPDSREFRIFLRSLSFHYSVEMLPKSHMTALGTQCSMISMWSMHEFVRMSTMERPYLDASHEGICKVSMGCYVLEFFKASILFAVGSFPSCDKGRFDLLLFLESSPPMYRIDGDGRPTLVSPYNPPSDVRAFLSSQLRSNVLMLSYPRGEWIHLASLFHPRVLTCPLFLTSLREVQGPTLADPEYAEMTPDLFSILWSIEALRSNWRQFFPLSFLARLYDDLQKVIVRGHPEYYHELKWCLQLHSPTFFFDIVDDYESRLKSPGDRFRSPQSFESSRSVFFVKRVRWTPSRLIYQSEIRSSGSRLERRLQNDFLINVLFTEDCNGPLRDRINIDSLKSFLKSGFMFYGLPFNYFLSSSSSLREHKAWFLGGAKSRIVEKRNEIIPNPSALPSVAKYVARLGLYGTNDSYAVDIPFLALREIPDIKAENGDLVTDGCGLISERLASRLNDGRYKTDPCAYQFRYSGFKGMLLRSSKVDELGDGVQILFRPSMKKFENDDTQFCIVQVTDYRSVTLNHEIITILCGIVPPSSRAALESYIFNLQDRCLEEYIGAFTTQEKAIRQLSYYMPRDVLRRIGHRFNLLGDPFWFSVLQRSYYYRVSMLRQKAKIPVSDGCLLYGVSDPSGVLRDNEVFVQISNARTMQHRVITGAVLIYRNPCLFPGDIRVVTAVDRSELHTYKNVLIFPAKNCRTSLSASCSGGDLDGDQFSIIWDTNLVPEPSTIPEPLDYSKISADAPRSSNVTDEDGIINFFAENVTNSYLGHIANIHLAMCDHLDGGIQNQICKDLAIQQSIAVDYPKTGKAPVIPEEANRRIKKDGYPDFMELHPSYPSQQLLGRLYRSLSEKLQNVSPPTITVDESIVTGDSYRAHIPSVMALLKNYQSDLMCLKTNYGIDSEADLFLCESPNPSLFRDKKKFRDFLRLSMDSLFRQYRALFDKEVDKLSVEGRYDYARAWYYLSYTTNVPSFTWIIYDVLCVVKPSIPEGDDSAKFHNALGESLSEFVLSEFRHSACRESQRDVCVQMVQSWLNTKSASLGYESRLFSVSLTGSSSFGLVQEEECISLVLIPESPSLSPGIGPSESIIASLRGRSLEAKDECEYYTDANFANVSRHYLEGFLLPVLELNMSEVSSDIDGSNPHVRGVLEDDDQSVRLEVGLSVMDYALSLYTLQRLDNDPCLYPYLWILYQWGWSQDLICRDSDSSSLRSLDFILLLLYLVNETTKSVPPIGIDGMRVLPSISSIRRRYEIESKTPTSQTHLGSLLGIFLSNTARKLDQIDSFDVGDMGIPLSIDYRRRFSVSVTSMRDLLLRSHDFSLLMYSSDCKTSEYSRPLPDRLSAQLSDSRHFHESYLSRVCNCEVTIKSADRKDRLVVIGKGNPASLSRLKSELEHLIDNYGVLNLNRNRVYQQYNDPACFQLVHRSGERCPVSVKDFLCSCQLRHESRCRQQLLISVPAPHDWMTPTRLSLVRHICRRLGEFPSGDVESLKHLQVSVVFGRFYLLDYYSESACLSSGYTVSEIQNLIIRNSYPSRIHGQCSRSADGLESSGSPRFPDSNGLSGFPSVAANRPIENPFQPERIPSNAPNSVESLDLIKRAEQQKLRLRRLPPKIGHGFTGGYFRSSDDCRKQAEMYHNSLTLSGFHEIQSGPVYAEEQLSRYSLEIHDPCGIHGDYRMSLSHDYRVQSLRPRRTRFVLSTLVLRDQSNNENDVRIKIDTYLSSHNDRVRQIQSLSPYFREVFALSGDATSPCVSSAIPSEIAKSVSEILSKENVRVYACGSVTAVIRCCLDHEIPFSTSPRWMCQLQFYLDSAPFVEYARTTSNPELLQEPMSFVLKVIDNVNRNIARVKQSMDMTTPSSVDSYC